jgi:hypothetical protein
MTKAGPRVTKLLENLLDQHGLVGAIEVVTDAPFTREHQIALLAQLRDDHKKSQARVKAAQRSSEASLELMQSLKRMQSPPRYEERKREAEERERQAKLRAEEHERQAKLRREIIREGRNAMAKKLHPDIGGSTEDMARLNREANRLKQVH